MLEFHALRMALDAVYTTLALPRAEPLLDLAQAPNLLREVAPRGDDVLPLAGDLESVEPIASE